jgi:hypothetical protein
MGRDGRRYPPQRGWALGGGGCVRRSWEQASGDMGRAILFQFNSILPEEGRQVLRTGAASGC